MKLVGFTDWNDNKVRRRDCLPGEAPAEVTETLAEFFKLLPIVVTGPMHQKERWVPVMSDGCAYRFSLRAWGAIVARARRDESPLAYLRYAFPAKEAAS